jgi:hypothetical protein
MARTLGKVNGRARRCPQRRVFGSGAVARHRAVRGGGRYRREPVHHAGTVTPTRRSGRPSMRVTCIVHRCRYVHRASTSSMYRSTASRVLMNPSST